MLQRLRAESTSATLLQYLREISGWPELHSFRLVGGTALSLQLGHRISVDIDLFTDADYGSIDFVPIYHRLRKQYPVIIGNIPDNKGFGCSFLIGDSKDNLVKLDLFYTDSFLFPPVQIEGIVMADLRDITLMKLEVISNGGRKKDFWDISELFGRISLDTMLQLYVQKYPFFETDGLIAQMTNFSVADEEPDPICLHGKYWELIKLDLEEMIKQRT